MMVAILKSHVRDIALGVRLRVWLRPFVHAWYRHTQKPRLLGRRWWFATQYTLARVRPNTLRSAVESNLAIGRSPAQHRTIVMLVISMLEADPRVEREARALAASGWRVIVVFPRTPGWAAAQVHWGECISFEPIASTARRFADSAGGFYGEALYQAAIRHQPFAFHAHDLNTAYVGLGAARKTGAHLVCDFHEWFSEGAHYDAVANAYVPHRPRQKAIYQWLEREVLSHASEVVTVCTSIAEALSIELGKGREVSVIRNIPSFDAEPTREYAPLKQQLGISPNRFVLLYQGGVGPSRHIEPIIEALGTARRCILVVRGPSIEIYGPQYQALAERNGAGDRLILQSAVPSRDVVAAARGADAGIYTVRDAGRNYVFALPNKVFEYMSSGLPLLVANYPEVARVVREYDVGLVFDPNDPASIAAAIDRLIDDPALAARLAANTSKALHAMAADQEWQKLVSIYEGLERNHSPGSSRTSQATG